jgi:quercetin 2,3-dioxygenase
MTSRSPILKRVPLGNPPWPTLDPFLFCVHHLDAYPKANEHMGPDASLEGRRIGMDFEGKDGWRMYHGDVVPGFPEHPHRGFETVTIARRGFIDHSDSLGATARFGRGDAQWMTAGAGVVHSEMFPLLDRDSDNPVELFQIWLNLPAKSKMVRPYFTMFWSNDIPRITTENERGRAQIVAVAGALDGQRPPPPPPDSWAANPESDVAIWSISMDAGSTCSLPSASHSDATRSLYFFEGSDLSVSGEGVQHGLLLLDASQTVELEAGDKPVECLMLQGRPIQEPVAHYGPFVMNTREELQQAMRDYNSTRFGGWPWPRHDPVHPRDKGRFALHADGRIETQ